MLAQIAIQKQYYYQCYQQTVVSYKNKISYTEDDTLSELKYSGYFWSILLLSTIQLIVVNIGLN